MAMKKGGVSAHRFGKQDRRFGPAVSRDGL
jgi:hypothetical protein